MKMSEYFKSANSNFEELMLVNTKTIARAHSIEEKEQTKATGTIVYEKVTGKVRDRFLRKILIERDLSETEETLLAILESSARKYGIRRLIDYLAGIPEEVLRRQAKLKEEAYKAGIGHEEFFTFVRFLAYCKKISLHKDVSRDQISDIYIAGNTTLLRIEELFNGGELIAENGVRLNGIFGKQGIVMKESDLRDVDDLMPFLYILNHSIHKKTLLPAYFLIFGETPNPIVSKLKSIKGSESFLLDYNTGPWFNANIALTRTEKFMDEAIGMSLDVTPHGIIIVDQNKQTCFLPIITALYDLTNMLLWRVERVGAHITAQRMDEWLKDNIDTHVYPNLPMFRRKDIVKKHIDRLIAHHTRGNEHMQLRNTMYKKVGCVDGRQNNNKSEIGSLIGEKQLIALMSDEKTIDVSIVFHTHCGYIVTATTLHMLFKVLKDGIRPDDAISLGRARLFINTLLLKPWIKRDKNLFKELMSHVDLSKVADKQEEQNTLHELMENLVTDSQGTLRYATSHMLDRGVFEMVNGFPVMIASAHVEEALAKFGIKFTAKQKLQLVIEELARLDRKNKLKIIETKQAVIESRRLSKLPTIEWVIEDFISGRYFVVNPKFILEQTKEEILSFKREDRITHKIFDLQIEAIDELNGAHPNHNHNHNHDNEEDGDDELCDD